MTHLRFNSKILAATCLALLFGSVASAVLPTRTWVSRSGLDSNPCSESAPCATFAGALSKTAAGGEIDCQDAGEFGNGSTLTISQAVTIDCSGAFGSILVATGSNGVIVSAGSNDVVTLRGLSINSLSGGISGITYTAGKAVHVENVNISVPTVNATCIAVGAAGTTLLTVDDATLSDCPFGIKASGNNTAVVNINNTRISNTTVALDADNGSRVTIRDSTIYFNDFGVKQTSLGGTSLGSTVTVVNCTLGFSNVAALQSLSGEFILAFGNSFVNDVVVFNPNGGSIFTGSDNNNSGSSPGTANGGPVSKI